jgi:hypothetical protein
MFRLSLAASLKSLQVYSITCGLISGVPKCSTPRRGTLVLWYHRYGLY